MESKPRVCSLNIIPVHCILFCFGYCFRWGFALTSYSRKSSMGHSQPSEFHQSRSPCRLPPQVGLQTNVVLGVPLSFRMVLSKPGVLVGLRAKWTSFISCYSLNENGLHRSTGSGTIRICVLVRVSVALLEEVCHWGLGGSKSPTQVQCHKHSPSLLVNWDVEFSATSSAPYLTGCHCDGVYMLSQESGTVIRCGPVGVGVSPVSYTHLTLPTTERV